MKFTKDWLDIHLKSKKKESQIIDKLNNIGLEVEKIEPIKNELSDFIIAKIIKADIIEDKEEYFVTKDIIIQEIQKIKLRLKDKTNIIPR